MWRRSVDLPALEKVIGFYTKVTHPCNGTSSTGLRVDFDNLPSLRDRVKTALSTCWLCCLEIISLCSLSATFEAVVSWLVHVSLLNSSML